MSWVGKRLSYHDRGVHAMINLMHSTASYDRQWRGTRNVKRRTIHWQEQVCKPVKILNLKFCMYRSADKSLARPGRKQATATEDFDVHISYLLS